MEIHYQTDVGKRRNTNQDYVGVFTNKQGYTLALLADGMGGHQAGDVASHDTVEHLGAQWQEAAITSSEKAAQWFIQSIQQENEQIFTRGQADPALNGMGTTLEAVAFFDDQFTIAHVGDSRTYLLRGGELRQLTEDHSLVNVLVKSGEITQEMAANHPRRNVVTRSIGMPGTLDVDVATHVVVDKDYLLLCSDGLTNMVDEATIQATIASSATLDEAVERLITLANDHGGVDNITVLLIRLGGDV
jgi:Serine/threonine protein phosphatase